MTERAFSIRMVCLISLALLLWAAPADAAGVGDAFFEAESCARALRKSPKAMKSRASWDKCINQYQAVYQKEPKGPWAPASLYHAGLLTLELSRVSGSEADRKAALDAFEQVQKKFPDSAYREKAAAELQKAREEAPAKDAAVVKTAPPPAAKPAAAAKAKAREAAPPEAKKEPTPAAAADAPKGFREAEACFRRLRSIRPTETNRREWMLCIGRFHNTYLQDPEGPWAAPSLYMEGVLYHELYKSLKFDSDLRAARENCEKILKEYPSDPYADKAARELQAMPRLVADKPPAPRPAAAPRPPRPAADSAPPAAAEEPAAETRRAEPGEEGSAVVEDLRFWSNPDYTRVVVYADRETDFSHRLLKRDPTIDKPPRLYVDLVNSRLGGGPQQKSFSINDDLLSDARAAQYTKDTVRVVVDIKSFETYKVFSLKDPFRIVIDVWGVNGQQARGPDAPAAAEGAPSPAPLPDLQAPLPPPKGKKVGSGALARQLALGVRRIVVDPGHGGKDFGAPGFVPGVHEKDVVLEISKRVARKIREQLDCEAILTRSDDRYLTLEERTAFANTHNADLFVSIHTNASRDPRASGIETYFLNLATDDDAIRVAAMENATSTKNISDLHSILNDLLKNAKINESSRLAAYVQTSLVTTLSQRGYQPVRDKGVKQAPFYVLLGARMPSILVETSFISNREECRRLTNAAYQDHLAESIVRGLRGYIKEISPTAFSEPPRRSPG